MTAVFFQDLEVLAGCAGLAWRSVGSARRAKRSIYRYATKKEICMTFTKGQSYLVSLSLLPPKWGNIGDIERINERQPAEEIDKQKRRRRRGVGGSHCGERRPTRSQEARGPNKEMNARDFFCLQEHTGFPTMVLPSYAKHI